MDTYPDVPRLPYSQVRPLIQNGDILLCEGESIFATLIRQATNSRFSHVAFVMRLDTIGRIVLIESVESIGVRIVPLGSYVFAYNGTEHGYKGRLFLARHADFMRVDTERLTHFSQNSIDLLGYPYDPQTILSIAARVVAGKLGMAPRPFIRNKAYICSELVWEMFHSIGIDIPYASENFIAPADFASCRDITFLWEIAVDHIA
jgi:hypothetical protein